MKGVALDTPMLVIILMLTFLLFIALATTQDSLETRATQRQAEIIATKGAYELMLDSLETTWKQIATDVVMNATARRFELPLYLYRFDATLPESAGPSPSCTANPSVCIPDASMVNTTLMSSIDKIELIDSFNITTTIGSISKALQQVKLITLSKNIALASDRATGSVVQNIDMKGGATGVSANPIITFDVPTKLSALVNAAKSVVSAASATHSANTLFSFGGDYFRTDIRAVQLGSLDGYLQSIFTQTRTFLTDIMQSADERTTMKWTVNGSMLKLEYDSGVRLTEGLQGTALIIVNCSDATKEFNYNRYAGAIEAAMPDILKRYVGEPRALLAAIAASNNWNPKNLFNNGETDAAKSAIVEVQTLLGAFESGTANVIPYDDWTNGCTFTSSRRLLRLPLNHELQIVGCFGDAACSGGAGDYKGIDILANDGESVYTMESGVVMETYTTCTVDSDCPTDPQLRGIGNYVIIRHLDSNGNYYYSVYGHLANVLVTYGDSVIAGRSIGTAGKTGKTTTPLLHVRLYERIQNDELHVNPCLYLGCVPATPQSEPGLSAQSLPKPTVLTSPQDYATFLTQKSGTVVALGGDFCAPSDRDYRKSNLGYGFYSAGNPSFGVWPAFDGTVLSIRDDEYGCGQSVYVSSGEFVTVYSGISAAAAAGDLVSSGRRIGTVRTSPDEKCPNPHLTVVFSEPSFILYKGTDRCGNEIDCQRGFSPTTCTVGVPCEPAPNVQLGVREEYCAAVEWPMRRTVDGTLWTRTASGFERMPVELGFRITDSLPMLDCSQYDGKRFMWMNTKDMLCYNNTLWTCGFDIQGAQRVLKGRCVGATDAGCTSGYVCSDKKITSLPAGTPSSASVLKDRIISKFCGSPATDTGVNDTARDWICCENAGGTFNCPSSKLQTFDGLEIACTEDACTI